MEINHFRIAYWAGVSKLPIGSNTNNDHVVQLGKYRQIGLILAPFTANDYKMHFYMLEKDYDRRASIASVKKSLERIVLLKLRILELKVGLPILDQLLIHILQVELYGHYLCQILYKYTKLIYKKKYFYSTTNLDSIQLSENDEKWLSHLLIDIESKLIVEHKVQPQTLLYDL